MQQLNTLENTLSTSMGYIIVPWSKIPKNEFFFGDKGGKVD